MPEDLLENPQYEIITHYKDGMTSIQDLYSYKDTMTIVNSLKEQTDVDEVKVIPLRFL